MKHRVFLFLLLLLIMAALPFLALPSRQNALETSDEAESAKMPILQKQESNHVPSSLPSDTASTQNSSSAPLPVESVLPVSNACSAKEPVLLLDKATGQVVKMSQSEYVVGAVCSEMPPKFHPEAIKAQAVAAHSYLLRCREQEIKNPNPELKGAYLAINTEKRSGYVSEAMAREMYGQQFSLYYPSLKASVEQVVNEILVYNNAPIVAAYHAISAGKTESASNVWTGTADYLVPVDSPGDRLAPDYEVVGTFSVEEAKNRLQTAYPNIELAENPETWFTDLTRSDSGYILSLRIGSIEIPGQTLRNLFEQRSSFLSINCQNGNFVFSATGYGHGVGMSQYGADYMARQGATYRDILNHYYTGAELVSIRAI